MKNKKIQRNCLDIILTDLKPVETPQIFTLEYFYNYLINRKFLNKKNMDAKKLANPQWHAAPLKYHIVKENQELREMSYLNPLSLIEVCLFLKKYEKILLSMMNKNVYSVRYHKKQTDLQYKDRDNKLVQYYSVSEEDIAESSGEYFKIVPHRRLDTFLKSRHWYDLNRRYGFYAKLDYNKCFDSIYTHTFNWVIASNTIDAKNISEGDQNVYVLSEIDKLLQNLNMSMTNGITVGPEFSRFLAEILLQNIDYEIMLDLKNKYNLNQNNEYTICRYVDDIFVFAQKEEDIEKIIMSVSQAAEKYRLKLNESKKEKGKLPKIWSPWLSFTNQYITVLTDMIFHRLNEPDIKYIVKEKQIGKPDIISKLKDLFQGLIISEESYSTKIVSYCLSTIFNKVAKRRVGKENKQIFNRAGEEAVYNFVDLIMYIYSYAATFNNTQKLISIFYTIEEEIGDVQFRSVFEDIIRRYQFVFTGGNIEDLLNLILYISNYKIMMSYDNEERILSQIEEHGNPVIAAVFLYYFEKTHEEMGELRSLIKTKIEDALYKLDIFMKSNIFQCRDLWWLFLFADCPHMETALRDKIKQKFDDIRLRIASGTTATQAAEAKQLVCDYMLDDNVKYKFINWDIGNNDFMKKIVFKTFERTIFNNNNKYDSIDVIIY